MKRREFISLLAGAATAWPLAAHAQRPARLPRIGIMSPGANTASTVFDMLAGFERGLRDLGYVEGQNVLIERRFADNNPGRLGELASALVGLKVDLIVAQSTAAARAAKAQTATIPIVAVGMADPVEDGLAATLARPGGNVTGTTFLGPELVGKRLQLLKDVVPNVSRVAALWHPHAYSERTMAGLAGGTDAAARALGLTLKYVPADSPDELAGAFERLTTERPDALIVFPSVMLFGEYPRVAQFVAARRLPSMGAAREFADLGGLMSYGVNLPDLARQTAIYADRILKGASPAELPVQQPVKFEFVINLTAARQLDLTISRELLLVADEVIE